MTHILGAWLLGMAWWKQCLGIWLAVVVALTSAGLLSTSMVPLREGYDRGSPFSPRGIPGIWIRWDANHYLQLARYGYEGHPALDGYFPVFPMSIAAVSRITGVGEAVAGMLIAQVSYLGAILLLYKLARAIQDDHGYAMRCVVALALFPTSFFFLAPYAESLYMLLAMTSAYMLAQRPSRYFIAGIAIGIASATRPIGWLLNVLLGTKFLRDHNRSPRAVANLIASLLLSVSGPAIFVLYLYQLRGTLLAIHYAQAPWGRHWQFPWMTLLHGIQVAVGGNPVPGDWFLYALNWYDLSMTILALALACIAVRWSLRGEFDLGLTCFLVGSLAFMLSSEGPHVASAERGLAIPLWGMSRWIAQIFPLYLILGKIKMPLAIQVMASASSAGTLVFLTAWWTSGRWVG